MRAVVLAAHRGRDHASDAGAVVRRAREDPGPQRLGEGSSPGRRHPGRRGDLGRARRRRGARPGLRRRIPDGGRAEPPPVAPGLRTDRRPAGLLPLGARLRLGLRRARRVRPAGRKPALGATRSDVEALLAEGDPWWQLAVKPTQAQKMLDARSTTLELPGHPRARRRRHRRRGLRLAALRRLSPARIPHLEGLQPDLYRCFMEQTWRTSLPRGVIGSDPPGDALHRREGWARCARRPTAGCAGTGSSSTSWGCSRFTIRSATAYTSTARPRASRSS